MSFFELFRLYLWHSKYVINVNFDTFVSSTYHHREEG